MSSESACMEESWDLQAVVRSGCSTNYQEFANNMNNPPSLFAPLSFDTDELLISQETYETPTDFDELDGLYRPFYPVLHQTLNSSQNNILGTCTNTTPIGTCTNTTSMSVRKEVKERQKVQKKKPLSEPATCPNSSTDATSTAKSKRRENQHKRVVQHVKEDGLSSDMWAWRKYGQKPIKGSPYPRSYYRCSSLKGCLARKQVERSSTDPSIFIITYTAEHSHARPTRRSSLAGSTRIKRDAIPKGTTPSIEPNMPTIKDQRSPNFDGLISPTTPSMTSIEDEFVQNLSNKNEELLDHGQILEENESKEIFFPDVVFSDDLFPTLEDLEGFLLDQ
ncbi:PREDICTED: WRKY transcription factor 22-like [Populus euphratica]|uniref:WRKY transcription factor 22-like n=1 Tax=Populus euphratica TaxID=75702 RepID=A0AAJ6XPY5_POPEU|nr:PREDICTED: WRKY transcription factor 22-like [Populus euphratica]